MERIRKKTEFYDAGVIKVPGAKELKIPAGVGIKLGDNKHFCKEIEKVKGDSDIVKALHTLFFGSAGKKIETKKHLRLFYGFAPDVEGETMERMKITVKIRDKKLVWTVALLKQAMDLLGLTKAGDREDLIVRLADYLMCPTGVEFDGSASIGKKRKSKSGATETLKKGPNAYQLYMMDNRPIIKEQNPGASFGDLAKLVAKAWDELDADVREEWRNKAAKQKAEKFDAIIDAGAEEDDFAESDKEEDVDAGVEEDDFAESDKEEGDAENAVKEDEGDLEENEKEE